MFCFILFFPSSKRSRRRPRRSNYDIEELPYADIENIVYVGKKEPEPKRWSKLNVGRVLFHGKKTSRERSPGDEKLENCDGKKNGKKWSLKKFNTKYFKKKFDKITKK